MLSDSLMSLLNKMQSGLMIPDKKLSYAYAMGVNVISYGCKASCSGDCEDSCAGGCEGSCSGSCDDSCSGSCQYGASHESD